MTDIGSHTGEVPIFSGYFDTQNYAPLMGTAGGGGGGASKVLSPASKRRQSVATSSLNLRRKWVKFFSTTVRVYNDNSSDLAVHEIELQPDSAPLFGAAIKKTVAGLPDLNTDNTVALRRDGGKFFIIQAPDKIAFKKLQVSKI